MPRTIRKDLIRHTERAFSAIDLLDEILYTMDQIAKGRQPAIPAIAPVLVQAHEQIRQLWHALRREL